MKCMYYPNRNPFLLFWSYEPNHQISLAFDDDDFGDDEFEDDDDFEDDEDEFEDEWEDDYDDEDLEELFDEENIEDFDEDEFEDEDGWEEDEDDDYYADEF